MFRNARVGNPSGQQRSVSSNGTRGALLPDIRLAPRLDRKPGKKVHRKSAADLLSELRFCRPTDATAQPISGLHERDLGALKGLRYEGFAEAPDSAETIDSVTRRAMAAIEALRDRYPAHEVVVVCHGAVIQSICAYITGVWSEDYPPNCGLVTIEYDSQGWRAPVKSGNWFPLTGSP